ncbi:MAG: LPXTG-site transpeptidase (sortase) family protein [Candidatus Paceibacteria bacterium]|jgi:LPXTG-site transpeptidase (sortase) family protein
MQFSDTVKAIWANKISFFGVFFIIFTALYALLVMVDFLPEAPEAVPATTEVTKVAAEVDVAPVVIQTSPTVESELVGETLVSATTPDQPISIYIERLDKTIEVLNPQSRSIADLDNALLSGVVRHPDSATPNIDGTTLILGHSSYLPNVLNKNFQAFNGVQNLEWGDVITLTSADAVYTYRVERVYEAKASEITVPIKGDAKLLTIATCDSFGSTDDRHIVEAKQISVKLL